MARLVSRNHQRFQYLLQCSRFVTFVLTLLDCCNRDTSSRCGRTIFGSDFIHPLEGENPLVIPVYYELRVHYLET